MNVPSRGATTLRIADRAVRLTSLDRVLMPAVGFTKADLLRAYLGLAPVLLPHLRDRPLSLHRFPAGVDADSFYQTRCPSHPPWLRTQRMHVFPRDDVEAPVLDDEAGIAWAANLSAIELHPFLALAGDLERPLVVVFDLDPGAPAGLLDAARLALRVRDTLEGLGLRAFPKTTGGNGLHVVVPLNTPHTFARTKAFARAVAQRLAEEEPERVVVRMAKDLRRGRILVDWSQNDAGKNTVAPYSLRGNDVPTVATPVTWEEVVEAVASVDPRRLLFTPAAVLERVERRGDLFAPVLELLQTLPELV